MDQSVRNLIEYSYNYIEDPQSAPDQKKGIGSIIAKQMVQKIILILVLEHSLDLKLIKDKIEVEIILR